MVRYGRLPHRKVLHNVAHAHRRAVRRQQIQNPYPRRVRQRLEPSRVFPRPLPPQFRRSRGPATNILASARFPPLCRLPRHRPSHSPVASLECILFIDDYQWIVFVGAQHAAPVAMRSKSRPHARIRFSPLSVLCSTGVSPAVLNYLSHPKVQSLRPKSHPGWVRRDSCPFFGTQVSFISPSAC